MINWPNLKHVARNLELYQKTTQVYLLLWMVSGCLNMFTLSYGVNSVKRWAPPIAVLFSLEDKLSAIKLIKSHQNKLRGEGIR
jgi:hypothetical protein